MKPYDNSNSMGEVSKPLLRRVGLVTLMLGVGLVASMPANATPPPANSVIGNQAVANYNDASGAPQTTLSNLVETTVLPVGSFTLTPDVDKSILAGQTAYMPHIITNNGNVPDVFNLTLTGVSNNAQLPVSIKVYADNNADGMPDELNAPLCTVTPAATTAMTTSPTPCKTASVPGGGSSYNLVVAVQSRSNDVGDTNKLWEDYKLRATAKTPEIYTTTFQEVEDKVRIDTGAIFDLTKSIDIPGGPASAATCTVASHAGADCKVARYTVTYTNRGGAVGTIQIQDLIGSAADPYHTDGMAYLPGTAKWSNNAGFLNDNAIAATPVAEYSDSNGASIYYEKLDTSAVIKTLNAFVTGVKPNSTGSISFDVLVLNTAKVGTSTTTNTAKFQFTASNPSTNPGVPTNNSNPASYIVGLGQKYDVVANDGTNVSGTPTDGNNAIPTTTSAEDLVVVATAAAGQTITFDNVIWNKGDGTDTFDVQLRPDVFNSFPVGTSFQLFKSDGVNPLLDTSGNGTPDTGAIPAGMGGDPIGAPNTPGSFYIVKVKATIPLNACTLASTNSCGATANGPYTIAKVATSVGDPTKSNTVFDQLTTITKPSVDLQNAGGAGSGSGFTGANITNTVVTAKTNIVPGTTTYFDLPVFNTSAIADSYVFTYHVATTSLGGLARSNFVDGTIPSDWKLAFRKGTGGACSATTVGAEITSSDLVNAGGSQLICAEVTTPSTATTTMFLHFRVHSDASGVSDVKIDSVAFASVGVLSLTPNRTGQVYPGGTIVYSHTLAATGSSSCTGTKLNPTMDQALINLGWNALIYKDNGSIPNQLDSTDTLVGPAVGSGTPNYAMDTPLNPGTPQKLLVQVFAPNGAALGATNLVNLVASGDCDGAGTTTATANANDLTTVITGQVRLYKTQAVDYDCSGTADQITVDVDGHVTAKTSGGGTYGTGLIKAQPGFCILYKVDAINEGVAAVKALSIKDVTPVYSTYSTGLTTAGCSGAGGTGTYVKPANGGTGNVTCTWAADLAPGAKNTMDFEVKIDQ